MLLRCRCMEDLVSTTRYVSWSLHNKVCFVKLNRKNLWVKIWFAKLSLPSSLLSLSTFQSRAGLRQFLDSFGGTENSSICNNPTATVISQATAQEKEDTKSQPDVKLSHVASGTDSSTSTQSTETKLADLLDSTLWNRRLAPSSERIVYGLVQQIFHGIREYFLVSTDLKVCNIFCLFMHAPLCV